MRSAAAITATLVLVLAACGAPAQPVDTSYSVRGTASGPPSAPSYIPLGVSLLLIDEETLGGSSVDRLGFIEVEDGSHLAPLSPVGADGSFELVFPDGDQVPASTLGPADAFVFNTRLIPACQVEASVSDANVTLIAWEGVSYPSLVVVWLSGADVAVVTTESVDLDEPGLDFFDVTTLGWVYADRAVDVATGAGCVADGFEIVVDVSLDAGWNQLEWVASEGEGADPDVLLLRNGDADEVYVQFGFGL